jgi:serine/threonine protein kinase
MPSPDSGGLSVDLDEDLIKWLVTKQWPNFINMHDTWKETTITEKLYIRMDWAGQTIRDLLPLGWKFIGPHWLDVMRGIANGLSQAHQYSIVHGDLKPSNSPSSCESITEHSSSR